MPPPQEKLANPDAPWKHGQNKRTSTQKEADMLFIERLSLRAVPLMQIVEQLNAQRPYKLSHVTVWKDLEKVRQRWRTESVELLANAKARELKSLATIEYEIWEAWERSKRDEISRVMSKNEAPETESTDGTKKPKRTTSTNDTATKRQRDGDVAFIRELQALSDRRVKLLGLAQADKIELTLPGGVPIAPAALTDDLCSAILAKHFGRMKRAETDPDNATRTEPDDNAGSTAGDSGGGSDIITDIEPAGGTATRSIADSIPPAAT